MADNFNHFRIKGRNVAVTEVAPTEDRLPTFQVDVLDDKSPSARFIASNIMAAKLRLLTAAFVSGDAKEGEAEILAFAFGPDEIAA